MAGHDEQRRSERIPIACEISIRRLSDRPFDGSVLNISTTGACISPPVRPKEGETVSLRFAGLAPVLAKVIWIDWPKVGVQFDTPINDIIFEHKFGQGD